MLCVVAAAGAVQLPFTFHLRPSGIREKSCDAHLVEGARGETSYFQSTSFLMVFVSVVAQVAVGTVLLL